MISRLIDRMLDTPAAKRRGTRSPREGLRVVSHRAVHQITSHAAQYASQHERHKGTGARDARPHTDTLAPYFLATCVQLAPLRPHPPRSPPPVVGPLGPGTCWRARCVSVSHLPPQMGGLENASRQACAKRRGRVMGSTQKAELRTRVRVAVVRGEKLSCRAGRGAQRRESRCNRLAHTGRQRPSAAARPALSLTSPKQSFSLTIFIQSNGVHRSHARAVTAPRPPQPIARAEPVPAPIEAARTHSHPRRSTQQCARARATSAHGCTPPQHRVRHRACSERVCQRVHARWRRR